MNPYLAILQFGSRSHDVSFEELFKYLTEQQITFPGGEKLSERNYILINIFRTSFQDVNGNTPTNEVHKGRFFLKPNALAYLMSYESLELAKADSSAARAEALRASKQAVFAIWIAILSLIISTIIAIYFR